MNAEHATKTGLALIPGREWSNLVSSSRAYLERLNIWFVEIVNETAEVELEARVPAPFTCRLHDTVGT